MPKKTEREDSLGFFNIHSVAKLQKKSHSAKKIQRGTLWSRPVLHVTRGNLLVQFPGPTGKIL